MLIIRKGKALFVKEVFGHISARNKQKEGRRSIMNKTELVAAVAAKAEITKKDAAAAVEEVFEVIGDELQKKEKVQLIGFGTFSDWRYR